MPQLLSFSKGKPVKKRTSSTTDTHNVASNTSATPTTTNSNNTRSVKRRASKACQCCRARKVRCDYVEQGSPCTNCRLDEIDCVVTESKRKRRDPTDVRLKCSTARRSQQQQQQPRQTSVASGNSSSSNNTTANATHDHERDHDCDNDFPYSQSPLSSPTLASQFSYGSCASPDHEGHVPHLIYQNQQARHRRDSSTGNLPLGFLGSSFSSHGLPGGEMRVGQVSSELPAYITPLPLHLDQVDIECLANKGALSLPSPWLRNQLLKSYLEFVHATLPVFEWSGFISAVESIDGSNGRVSLLLFQAVLYAASAFVDATHFTSAGYPSKKAARQLFFNQVQLLYDFNIETNSIVIIQSLLLMSFSPSRTNTAKDSWHYLGIATSVADSIKLNRNVSADSNIKAPMLALRKRLWWCLYTQDRLLALERQSQPRIRDGEYDVPMLSPQDLESQGEMAELFICKTKLCLVISCVLNSRFNEFPTNSSQPTLQTCEFALKTWHQSLPPIAVYSPPSKPGTESSIASVHRAILHLMYASTIFTLHLPLLRSSQQNMGAFAAVLHQAASTTTIIASNLLASNVTNSLPSAIVPPLYFTSQFHLRTLHSPSAKHRQVATAALSVTLRLLHALRPTFDVAESAFFSLQSALHASPLAAIKNPETDKSSLTPPPDTTGLQWASTMGAGTDNHDWANQHLRQAQQQVETPPLSSEDDERSAGGLVQELERLEPIEVKHEEHNMQDDFAEDSFALGDFETELWGMVDLDCEAESDNGMIIPGKMDIDVFAAS